MRIREENTEWHIRFSISVKMEKNHRFKVNLKGMITLLSDNLYSNPSVYIRELLQNAVDAISARLNHQNSDFEPTITVNVDRSEGIKLTITDNGIGLNEEEVHEFIGMIGNSSKVQSTSLHNDYIGRFGIGLLSCFVVSEDIKIITKSNERNQAVVWHGYSDGSYSTSLISEVVNQGTQVILTSKKNFENYFKDDYVIEYLREYGGILPYPIRYISDVQVTEINESRPKWLEFGSVNKASKEELLKFGKEIYKEEFLDCIPLESELGGICGVAYILPYSIAANVSIKHRVYLKNMLLSAQSQSLIPEWAFFVKCILNVKDLEPLASREGFYRNEKLLEADKALGKIIKKHLIYLLETNKKLIDRIMSIHGLAFKGMVANDEEFFDLFLDSLTFITTQGVMRFSKIREESKNIYYVTCADEFRQIENISYSKTMAIINAGYMYDIKILERAKEKMIQHTIEEITAITFLDFFDEINENEYVFYEDFMTIASKVMNTYQCTVSLKRFEPIELPALYLVSAKGKFKRQLEKNMKNGNGVFDDVLNNMINIHYHDDSNVNELCLNLNSAIIRQLLSNKDKTLIVRMIELIYVQTLLMGHHQLHDREYKILEKSLSYMIGNKDIVTSEIM